MKLQGSHGQSVALTPDSLSQPTSPGGGGGDSNIKKVGCSSSLGL